MNIGHRINARKIMFAYLYTDFFYRNYQKTEQKEATSIAAKLALGEDNEDFLKSMNMHEIIESDSEIIEWTSWLGLEEQEFSVIAHGMRMDLDEVDRDYIGSIFHNYKDLEWDIAKKVDPLLTQFKWNDLEAMKKALFVLWYTEYTVLGTDKKVVINEMIELAKRYGGVEVYKLVNSVFHELLMWWEEKNNNLNKLVVAK